jgi:hypothetical protein
MGTVVDLRGRRHPNERGTGRPGFVTCAQCGERHPLVRLPDRTVRCPTAFTDGERWYCLNRGCRAAWIERHAPPK